MTAPISVCRGGKRSRTGRTRSFKVEDWPPCAPLVLLWIFLLGSIWSFLENLGCLEKVKRLSVLFFFFQFNELIISRWNIYLNKYLLIESREWFAYSWRLFKIRIIPKICHLIFQLYSIVNSIWDKHRNKRVESFVYLRIIRVWFSDSK